MPTLIIEQPGKRTGGRIPGLVLIGRLPTNGIVLNDSAVSRLHAWIDRDPAGHYFVADIGSLTGTRVNGRPIERRQTLHDGDVVRIGQTAIVFSDETELPTGVMPVDLTGRPPEENVADAGVLFSCPCGAPAWFKAGSIGLPHKCRHCGRTVRIPSLPGVIAEVIEEPPVVPEPGVPVGKAHSLLEPHPVDEHGLSDSIGHALTDSMAHGLSDSVTHDPSDDSIAHGITDGAASHEAESADSATAVSQLPVEMPVQEPRVDEPLLEEPLIEEIYPDHEVPSEPQPVITVVEDAHGITEESAPDTVESSLSSQPVPAVVEEPLAPTDEGHAHPAAAEAEPAGERPPLFQHFRPAPPEPEPAPAVAEAHPAEAETCSVCHGEIAPGEETTTCPSCGLTFHAECWIENKGCSAYGCPQVGALRTAEEVAADAQKTAPDEAAGEPEEVGAGTATLAADAAPAGFPWEFLFLATSVVGVLLGTLAYGIPALVAALGTLLYLTALKDNRTRRGILLVALLVCLIGAGVGAWFSYRWYHGWPPVHKLMYRSTWRNLF